MNNNATFKLTVLLLLLTLIWLNLYTYTIVEGTTTDGLGNKKPVLVGWKINNITKKGCSFTFTNSNSEPTNSGGRLYNFSKCE